MKRIDVYLDFISPYAHLAFAQLPEALIGHSVSVHYRPVLFAGMLKHHGQLGPAEIAPKRDWTYRQVLWLAKQHGVELRMPTVHPFNPLGLLRLALACGEAGQANRYVCETVFHHAWNSGQDAACPQRLADLQAHLKPRRDPQSDAVKAELKANTEQAIGLGAFGVPTFVIDDKLFWGFDALPMLAAYLGGDAWFDGPDWHAAAAVGTGPRRARAQ
jgi:2-hydroxychromene-2-carboxylate isomerase